jgi:hypothetical protein
MNSLGCLFADPQVLYTSGTNVKNDASQRHNFSSSQGDSDACLSIVASLSLSATPMHTAGTRSWTSWQCSSLICALASKPSVSVSRCPSHVWLPGWYMRMLTALLPIRHGKFDAGKVSLAEAIESAKFAANNYAQGNPHPIRTHTQACAQ